MSNPLTRLPVLGATAVLALGGAGSAALAHDGPGDHHDRGAHHGKRHHGDFKRYSAWDKQWLQMSIEGDRFEIAGGKLAQDKGTTDQVKALGARLIQDHTKSLEDAIAVAQKLGIEVPNDPSPSQQWELKTLSRFDGATFDKAYADLEVQDHMQDIDEAQSEVQEGKNLLVRKLAKDDLPTLHEHLKLSQAALEAAGGNG